MKSRIFQIESVPMNDDEALNFDQLTKDYANECLMDTMATIGVDYFDRSNLKEDIYWLLDSLPFGMFEYDSADNSLTYVEKPTKFLEDYVAQVKELVSKLTVDSLLNDSLLKFQISSMVAHGSQYVHIFNNYSCAADSIVDWVINVVNNHKIGDKFYIYSSLLYHF